MASWILSSCPSDQLRKPPKLHLGICVPEKVTMSHQKKKINVEGKGVFLYFYFKCDLNLSQKTLLSSTAYFTLFTKLLTTQKLRLDLEVAHREKPDLLQQPTLAKKRVFVNLHSTFRIIDLKACHQPFQVSNIPE